MIYDSYWISLKFHTYGYSYTDTGFLNSSAYLVGGSNPSENISQIGNLPQIGMKITKIWNHLVTFCLEGPFLKSSPVGSSVPSLRSIEPSPQEPRFWG